MHPFKPIICSPFQLLKTLPCFVLCSSLSLNLSCHPGSFLVGPLVLWYDFFNGLPQNFLKFTPSFIHLQALYCTFQLFFPQSFPYYLIICFKEVWSSHISLDFLVL